MIMRTLVAMSLMVWTMMPGIGAAASSGEPKTAIATFAGGCFWCMQPPFDQLPGVLKATVGYIGGSVANPSYKTVSAGGSGHLEAIQIEYAPAVVDFEKLLDVFWHNIDPKNGDGQFCDTGKQYRSAIFYQNEDQKQLAEKSKALLEQDKKFTGLIKTEIRPATTFFAAEEDHQKYYQKNRLLYKFYRFTCGRDRKLQVLWGISP